MGVYNQIQRVTIELEKKCLIEKRHVDIVYCKFSKKWKQKRSSSSFIDEGGISFPQRSVSRETRDNWQTGQRVNSRQAFSRKLREKRRLFDKKNRASILKTNLTLSYEIQPVYIVPILGKIRRG